LKDLRVRAAGRNWTGANHDDAFHARETQRDTAARCRLAAVDSAHRKCQVLPRLDAGRRGKVEHIRYGLRLGSAAHAGQRECRKNGSPDTLHLALISPDASAALQPAWYFPTGMGNRPVAWISPKSTLAAASASSGVGA